MLFVVAFVIYGAALGLLGGVLGSVGPAILTDGQPSELGLYVGVGVGLVAAFALAMNAALKNDKETADFLERLTASLGRTSVLRPLSDGNAYLLLRQGEEGQRMRFRTKGVRGSGWVLEVDISAVRFELKDDHDGPPVAEFEWKRPCVVKEGVSPTSDYQWAIDDGMLVHMTVTGRSKDCRLRT